MSGESPKVSFKSEAVSLESEVESTEKKTPPNLTFCNRTTDNSKLQTEQMEVHHHPEVEKKGFKEYIRYLGILIMLISSCQNGQRKSFPPNSSIDKIHALKKKSLRSVPILREEFFVDSLHIGRKSFDKIEVSKYKTTDSIYVIIKFYSKQNKGWLLKNEFHFKKDGVTDCETKLSDFNGDGFNDMTYVSAVAARGANEIRRLFIYDKINDKLTCMKNSEKYPNMLYNKDLNCIDAFLVYGGCSTVFLKISGDSLKEFASVELFDGLTVKTYDNGGKEKIILQDNTNQSEYIRYKNYKPLKENDRY